MSNPTPEPVEVVVCSICHLDWATHVSKARDLADREYRDSLDTHDDFERSALDAARDGAEPTTYVCMLMVKEANQGPMGPVGCAGMPGRDGKDLR